MTRAELASRLMQAHDEAAAEIAALNKSELHVLTLSAKGYGLKEIGVIRGRSERTVEHQRYSGLKKLGADLPGACVLLAKAGIV